MGYQLQVDENGTILNWDQLQQKAVD